MSVRAETRVQRAPLAVPQVHSKLVQAQTRLAWILLAPSLLVVAFVALVPLVQTISQSFTNARLASERAVSFVGVTNYFNLFTDTDFLRSIWITVQFTVVTVVFEFLLGLLIALVVNSNFKGRGPMRAAMLVPSWSPHCPRNKGPRIFSPGATRSGFMRPSPVGPLEEKYEIP